jgi:hypothetical protein
MMTYRVRDKLKDQLLSAAGLCASPFTVAEMLAGVSLDPSGATVGRALAELVEAGALTMVRQYPRFYVLGRPEASTVDDPAPDWSRFYPSGGEAIGPTWQAMWSAMADGGWHDTHELVPIGQEVKGCAFSTVRNQLLAACKAGLIEPEARLDETQSPNRWRIWYRRPDRVTS